MKDRIHAHKVLACVAVSIHVEGEKTSGLTLEAWSWYQCIFDIGGMFRWSKQAVGRSLNISDQVSTADTYFFVFTRFRFQQLVLQLLFFLCLAHRSERPQLEGGSNTYLI